jgi:hypothetical protein
MLLSTVTEILMMMLTTVTEVLQMLLTTVTEILQTLLTTVTVVLQMLLTTVTDLLKMMLATVTEILQMLLTTVTEVRSLYFSITKFILLVYKQCHVFKRRNDYRRRPGIFPSANAQTHPARVKVKWPVHEAEHSRPHKPRLRMSGAVPLLPPRAFILKTGKTLLPCVLRCYYYVCPVFLF